MEKKSLMIIGLILILGVTLFILTGCGGKNTVKNGENSVNNGVNNSVNEKETLSDVSNVDRKNENGTSIIVNNATVELNKLNEKTVGQYYGTKVATLDGVDYGLFYVDYAGKFGEAGSIYLRALTSVGSTALDTVTENKEAISIMKELNPEWAIDRGTEEWSSYYDSEKGASYLCNPNISIWAGAKTDAEKKYGASNVNYVIGAPSVELFMASYNAKFSSKDSTKYFGTGIKYKYPGYLYSNDGGTTYTTYSPSEIPSNNAEGGMYLNTNNSEWMSSPLSNGTDSNLVCFVGDTGALSYYRWFDSLGVAPLVSLKHGVDLTK